MNTQELSNEIHRFCQFGDRLSRDAIATLHQELSQERPDMETLQTAAAPYGGWDAFMEKLNGHWATRPLAELSQQELGQLVFGGGTMQSPTGAGRLLHELSQSELARLAFKW